MKKIVAAVLAALCVCGARAEERTVSTAADLVAALEALNSKTAPAKPNIIYLEPGNYDVSAYSMPYWDTSGNTQLPAKHLALSCVTVSGKTDNPRDTVIYGNGTDGIVHCYYGELKHLTISNGCDTGSETVDRGGGVYSGTHSNVIVTCCYSKSIGGGVAGGTWYDCTIISNRSASNGGGVYSGTLYGCNVISNYSPKTGGGCYYGTKLHDCFVMGNTAGTHGGGVGSTDADASTCHIYGGLITGNTALGDGGGANGCDFYGGTVVSNNTSNSDGGGVCAYSRCFASNITVCCNTAAGGGGGIYGALAVGCEVFGNASGNRGGGGVRGVVCESCIISNNATTSYGGGGYLGTYTNCTISGNTALRGGGVYGNVAVAVDCRIVGNTTIGESGGGCYGGSYTDCTIADNLSLENGGGGYGGTYTNCLIACNMATSGVNTVQGGGLYLGKAYSCVISNNTVQTLGEGKDAYGAGVSGTTVHDSVVVHNLNKGGATSTSSSAYGGGVHEGTVSNTLITGNAVCAPSAKNRQGGGAFDATLRDCVIRNNYVDSNNGSGVNSGKLYGCVISNNLGSSSTSYALRQVKWLENCEVVGIANVYSGPAINCRFVNFTNGVYLAPGENVYWTDGKYRGGGASVLLNYGLYATNCLIANNTAASGIFNCADTKSVKLTNCTITGNRAENTFINFEENSSVVVVNSLFSGNQKADGTAYDMSYDADNAYLSALSFENCLIGPLRPSVPPGAEVNTVTSSVPGFVGRNGPDRYALKYSSPARGKGLVQNWMTNALDIRQDSACPRLRNGAVDIGCYQCWLDPVGLWFSIR